MIHNNDKMYKCFQIPKRGKSKKGQFREIQDPVVTLKNVQRVILSRFLEPIPMGDHVGAYVPGRSCKHTAQQHTNKGIIVSLDLKNFFPTVKRSMIRRVLHAIGYNHEVASLLAQLMCYKNFVPQGAPTSGFIANLVADRRFDREIIRRLHILDKHWVYTRYSDDIDISHPEKQTDERIKQIIVEVSNILRTSGFTLNDSKTKLEPQHWRQRVLGMVVNEKVNIPKLDYTRLRSLIHNCYVHGFDSQYARAGAKSAEALRAHIRGKLNFFHQISEDKADWLKEKFERACAVHEDPNSERVTF